MSGSGSGGGGIFQGLTNMFNPVIGSMAKATASVEDAKPTDPATLAQLELLKQEKRQFQTGTLLTGPQGPSDMPTTTSSIFRGIS